MGEEMPPNSTMWWIVSRRVNRLKRSNPPFLTWVQKEIRTITNRGGALAITVTLDLSAHFEYYFSGFRVFLGGKVAHVTLYHDDAYKSYLELPVGD